jgi:hypothetical protein
MPRKSRLLVLALFAGLVGCNADRTIGPTQVARTITSLTDTAGVPLSDLLNNTYLGFEGGLYPGVSDTLPTDHAAIGISRGKLVERLNSNGKPSPGGKYVLLSIGMSNASEEWCGLDITTKCDTDTFMALAAADAAINHSALIIVNGAQGQQTAAAWDSPTDNAYSVVVTRLKKQGVYEKQVQVIWLKNANLNPVTSLPATNADAYTLESVLGNTLRTLLIRYPNLKQVFMSSRIYGGYATTPTNPEPYAYESGFTVKWLIGSQINQMRGLPIDSLAGDLNYNSTAPWVAWAAYHWANGTTPRSDGLIWLQSDFNTDGTHPSPSGIKKVSSALLTSFKTSKQTQCWFVVGGICG